MAKIKASAPVVFVNDDRVKVPGYYLLEGDVETDANGVEHHTKMEIGDQVYAGEDGFVTDPPEVN